MDKTPDSHALVSNTALKSHKRLQDISKALCHHSNQDPSYVPSTPISLHVLILPVPWTMWADRVPMEVQLEVTVTLRM